MSKRLQHGLKGGAAPDETMRILVVNPHPGSELTRQLSRDGHDVLELATDDRPRRLLGVFAPELILILGAEPAEICHELREAAPDVPIVAVVPGRAVEDRVAVLDAGADDCLGVPLHRAELGARLRAVRRHRALVAKQAGMTARSPAAGR